MYQSLQSPNNNADAQSALSVDGASYNYNRRLDDEPAPLSGEQLCSMIRDLFYASGRSLFELYNEGKLANSLDKEGLAKIV